MRKACTDSFKLYYEDIKTTSFKIRKWPPSLTDKLAGFIIKRLVKLLFWE